MRRSSTSRYRVSLKVLPGEPLDGAGRVCIHLFVRDERGSFVEPHVLHMEDATDKLGKPAGKRLVARPTRGRIACDRRLVPNLKPSPRGVISLLVRTEEISAVTCPKCEASAEYKEIRARRDGGG